MAVVSFTAKDIRSIEPAMDVPGVMAETATLGDVLRRNSSGLWVKANASTPAGCRGELGIAVAGSKKDSTGALVAGEQVTVCILGRVTGFTNLDETADYYVGDSASGDIEDSAGAVTRYLAAAESTVTLFVCPCGAPSS